MHPFLEKEHSQLMALLDALDKCISTGDSANRIDKYLSDFVELVEREFSKEEEIMDAYRYAESTEHKKEHADLLGQLLVLKYRLDSGHTPFGKAYMHSLRDWFEGHLFDADSRLDEFLHQVNANRDSTEA